MIGETSEPTYIQPEVSSSPVNSRPPFLHFSPPRSIPSNYYHRQFPTKVMVEPLSIVGAIAAATQLARYVFHCLGTLSDYPGDLRSAPDRIKELLAEVDDFISIAKSVSLESHTSARSNHLRAQVTRCVRTASALKQLLQPLRITDNDTRRSKLRKCISFRGKWTRIARMLGDINGSQARLLFFMTSASFPESTSTNFDIANQDALIPATQPESKCAAFSLPAKSNILVQETVIDSLRDALSGTYPNRNAALVGLGGIGKSQTALEYLHEIRRTSPSVSVFWVQASNQTVFERSLLEIGQYYRSFIEEDGDTDLAGTIEDVKTILQADDSSQWLLVIDDIDLSTFDDIQALYSSIPDSKNGSIIYTTRNKQTAYDLVEPSHVIIMEPLSVAHAHQLLNFQLGRQIPLDADLLKLFAILDYLPLAIVQAAGYMCVNSISICACLAHIQRSEECKANLLRYARPSTMDAKPPYAPILLSIVSIDAIYDQNEAAAELLFTMACMESRHVPTCLFTTGENTTIEMDAFSILKAYSLITMNDADTVLDVQSLVHLAVRLHLKSINRFEVYLQRCFTLLASRFPPEGEQFLKLDQCALYLPHALEVWNTYVGVPEVESTSSVDCNMAERLASRISRYLRIIGQYAEAKVFAQSALEWSIKASGEGSTRSLACKRNVAAIDLYLGNHKSSDQAINDILDAQIDLLEKNDPAVISTLNEKGLALQVQGRHAEAEDYHQHAVFITESLYGADDNRTLDQQQNLALSLMGQGKHVNALNILQVVLDSLEESLGSTNTKTLSTLVNISCVLQHLARWEEAGKYLEQALLGRQKLLGAEHPHTLQCKANLAQIYRQQGDLSKAEGVTREVLQSHQSQLGSQHPTTLHINRNLALLLQCRKRYDEAEKEFQRVRRGREKRLGCEHPDTLISMYDLSVVYHYQGRLDEALELGRSVFDVRTRTLEDGHADRRASERHIQQLEIDYDEWLTSTTLAESGEET